MSYNIAIIEDDDNIRRSISEHFSESEKISCVMAVDSIEKFLKYYRDFLGIKLILLDVMLHNQSSIIHIPHILQRNSEVEIIMFTVMDDSTTIFQALTYGATGYLIKDISMEELEKSLLKVLEGTGALISPAVAKKIIQHFNAPGNITVDEDQGFSEKRNQVIGLLNEGRSYDEIAERLGMTVNGVRYYVKSIYKKLNISSRGELYRITKKEEKP
jgi:DNA-binding NarL/FixJ family response regulator